MKKKKLTKDQKRSVLAILTVGCSRKTAAKYIGFSYQTLLREIRASETFQAEVQKAEEESEVFYLNRIRTAAGKDQYWRAAAWALERRFPNRYAAKKAQGYTAEQVQGIVESLSTLVVEFIIGEEEQKKFLERAETLLTAKE